MDEHFPKNGDKRYGEYTSRCFEFYVLFSLALLNFLVVYFLFETVRTTKNNAYDSTMFFIYMSHVQELLSGPKKTYLI